MTSASATEAAGRGGAMPFVLDRSDRLEALFAPIRGMSRAAFAVFAGSAALHLVLVSAAIVTSRAPAAVSTLQETVVEVVQEVPKAALEAPKPPQKAEAPKPAPPAAAPPKQIARSEPPKPELSRPEPPKTEAPKPSVKDVTEEREALLKELAALRAQESKLERQPKPQNQPKPEGQATPEARQPPAGDLGMGPLPDSFQAVALPSSNEAAGEAMGFKELVFSQLAKAKGLDEHMGLPGTAGVRFDIDSAGGLVTVEVVRPSGVAALDREALDIVRRAAPFPVPPQGAQRSFVANVSFVAQDKP